MKAHSPEYFPSHWFFLDTPDPELLSDLSSKNSQLLARLASIWRVTCLFSFSLLAARSDTSHVLPMWYSGKKDRRQSQALIMLSGTTDNILKWSLWVRKYVRTYLRSFVGLCVRSRKYLNNGYRYFDETWYMGTWDNAPEPVFLCFDLF
jgi:hypothetical protein